MQKRFTNRFSPYLFWDMDVAKLNFNSSCRFVMERVYSKGTLSDVAELIKLYGLEKIKNEIVKIPYLDAKTHNYLSLVFKIPRSKFKCCKNKQSRKNFWNF